MSLRANSRPGSLTSSYKHLYEIRSIKRADIDIVSREVRNIDFAEPLVNKYREGAIIKVFIATCKVIIISCVCPENILDLLSMDEMHELLSENEFDIFTQTMMSGFEFLKQLRVPTFRKLL